jgi:hypothetical protein
VENVGDLRLVVQEGLLRGLGLPIRLCVWIEDELARVATISALPLPFDAEQKQKRFRGDDGKGRRRYQCIFESIMGVNCFWLLVD